MLIVLLMAGVTIHRGLLIPIVHVAALARHLHVLISQLVPRLVVIEPNLFPIPIGVTFPTGVSQFPFMLIVLLVAAVTIRRGVTILD